MTAPVTDDFFVDHAGGEVLGFGRWSAGQPAPAVPPGLTRLDLTEAQYLAVQAAPDAYCVIAGAVQARTANPATLSASSFAADGVDDVTISAIPAGSRLRVIGVVSLPWTAVTGGTAALTSTTPGRLLIEIRSPAPHLAWMGVADAV